MSRKTARLMLYLAGAVVLFATVALAGDTKAFRLYSDSVLPNGQTLKAGQYQVIINESNKEVTFKQEGKVVASVACQIQAKSAKNETNETYFGNKGATPEIQEIRFGGERRSILFVESGSTALGR